MAPVTPPRRRPQDERRNASPARAFRREAADRYVFIDSLPDRSNLVVYSLADIQRFMQAKCIEKRGKERLEGMVIAVFASGE